jgi:hypothetical protein
VAPGSFYSGPPSHRAVIVVRIVVPERHEDVAGVPGHVEVFDAGVVRQAIEWQVGLDEAPMLLAFQSLEDQLQGPDSGVEPGRRFADVAQQAVPLEAQVRDDALRPGRACVGGGYDDVVGAADEVVPPRAVEVVVLVRARSFGQPVGQHTGLRGSGFRDVP